MDVVTYSLCKKIAAGAVSGISKLEVDGTTLAITTNDGQILTMDFPTPKDGVSIDDIFIEDENLFCVMSNGEIIDAGTIPYYVPKKGVDYFTEDDKEELIRAVLEQVDESLVLDII